MRYYTPAIFSFLSPALLCYHLFIWSQLGQAAEPISEFLPVSLAELFGGRTAVCEFLKAACTCYFLVQVAFIAALVIALPIINIVLAAKGKLTPKSVSVINLLLKLLTIPFYFLLVFAPIIAVIGSVWGIGIALAIVILTLAAVIATGIFSIPAAISSARHKKISKGASFLMGFCSFLPVLDIIVAIAMTVISFAKPKPAAPQIPKMNPVR